MKATYRIDRISIASTVRVGTIVAAAIGLVIGIIWAFFALFFSAGIAAMTGSQLPNAGALLVVFVPVMVMMFYTIMGAIGSFLFALLYNLTAGLFGGIDVVMTDNRPEEKQEGPRFDFV